MKTLYALFILLAVSIPAQAASLTMDRNTDDTVKYIALECTTSDVCVPTTRVPALDILQPTTGAPIIVVPLTEKGRIGYKAQDLAGNQSGLSNVIPFRGAPLNAPSGVLELP
jgi:hypothetical protein